MNPRKYERREKIRFDVEDLHGGVRLPLDARIVDLSLDGLGIETTRWLQVGRRYTVTLPTEEGTLRVRGRIAWCMLARTARNDKGEAAPVYRAGIQFHEPDPAALEEVESLLSRAARVGVESSVHGRFRYRQEDPLDVVLEHGFTVRRLSLKGMLVESDVALELESRLRVALHVDEEVLEIDVRVAYVEPMPEGDPEPVSRIGLEWVDLAAEQRKLLQEIMRRKVSAPGRFVGNPETAIYHRGDCRHAAACSSSFRTRRQAEAQGFRPGRCCLA